MRGLFCYPPGSTVIVIPAIDIKQGKCVRLRQGRMESATVFNDAPSLQAQEWESLGARRIHVVDLDGAVGGRPVNINTIKSIVRSVEVPVQLGGGIREESTVQMYLDLGIATAIVGSIAAKDPELVLRMLESYAGRVAVGIDARSGWVAAEGWTESTKLTASELAAKFESRKPAAFIYTDIERDGMMSGPNINATREFAKSTTTPIILSGGVSCIEDVRRALPLEKVGVQGIIIGRALYDGAIDLREAIRLTEQRDAG